MVAFDRIRIGDTLWDCHKVKQGNTTLSKMACFPVTIISLDTVKGTALASWNGNPPKTYYTKQLAKLRRSRVKEK